MNYFSLQFSYAIAGGEVGALSPDVLFYFLDSDGAQHYVVQSLAVLPASFLLTDFNHVTGANPWDEYYYPVLSAQFDALRQTILNAIAPPGDYYTHDGADRNIFIHNTDFIIIPYTGVAYIGGGFTIGASPPPPHEFIFTSINLKFVECENLTPAGNIGTLLDYIHGGIEK